MIIQYSLTEEDYITYQLYTASRSETIKSKRQRNKNMVPVAYLAGASIFIYLQKNTTAIAFGILAVLWYFLYPFWERQRYITHYKKFVEEKMKDVIGIPIILEITNQFIVAKDGKNETKISTSEVLEIHEISTLIMIRIKGGQSFLIPKTRITGIYALTSRLHELAGYLKVNYVNDENWKWS